MKANVQDFLGKASDVVGEYHRDDFYEEYRCQFDEGMEIDSPIEQLFYCAVNVLLELNYIAPSETHGLPGHEYVRGVGIWPQEKIHKYRVDFLMDNQLRRDKNWIKKEVIVECDSQVFHERTEAERRYEKKRDRDLTRLGYKVFHFTGKEITDNPYLPAKEALEYLCEYDIEIP